MRGANRTRGLLMVFTGEGKGKTTAALGMAFRAMGHGQRVAVVQFIKGSWPSGELEAAARFSDLLEIHVTGRGFTWQSEDLEQDRRLARKGWQLACSLMGARRHRLVILDELTYLVRYGILDEDEVVSTLCGRPPDMHLVVTGRHAGRSLIEAADLVTEMRAVKHPYSRGIEAQEGVEF